MPSAEFSQFLVAVLFALSAGAIAWVLAYPFFSDERLHKKRLNALAGVNRLTRGETRQQQARRKQVQDTLEELNDRQKTTRKISIRRRLEQAGLDISVQTFYALSVITGALAGLFMLLLNTTPLLALLGGLGAGYGLPRYVLARLARRRQKKFLAEFANTIDIIVRGVKSGLPLNDCLEIIANESPEPVRSEFRQVVEHQRVGVPTTECFARLGERMPVPEVNFFSIVLSIQQKSGGNLAEALSNLSDVLRGRKRLQGKVQAFSSEAKSSAMIIGALPILVMLLVYVTTPSYVTVLFTEPVGRIMLGVSAVWMSLGILIMKKMINFDY